MGKGSQSGECAVLAGLVDQIKTLDQERAVPAAFREVYYRIYALRLNRGESLFDERVLLQRKAQIAENEVEHLKDQSFELRCASGMFDEIINGGEGEDALHPFLSSSQEAEMLLAGAFRRSGTATFLARDWYGKVMPAKSITMRIMDGFLKEELHKAERKIQSAKWGVERIAAQRGSLAIADANKVTYGFAPSQEDDMPTLPKWSMLGPLLDSEINWQEAKKSARHQPFKMWLVGMTGFFHEEKGLVLTKAAQTVDGIHKAAHGHLIWKHSGSPWTDASKTIRNYWNDRENDAEKAVSLLRIGMLGGELQL